MDLDLYQERSLRIRSRFRDRNLILVFVSRPRPGVNFLALNETKEKILVGLCLGLKILS